MYYTDINECLIDNGGCEYNCTNLEGINSTTGLGYQCGCHNGYQLASNNHDCIGKEHLINQIISANRLTFIEGNLNSKF